MYKHKIIKKHQALIKEIQARLWAYHIFFGRYENYFVVPLKRVLTMIVVAAMLITLVLVILAFVRRKSVSTDVTVSPSTPEEKPKEDTIFTVIVPVPEGYEETASYTWIVLIVSGVLLLLLLGTMFFMKRSAKKDLKAIEGNWDIMYSTLKRSKSSLERQYEDELKTNNLEVENLTSERDDLNSRLLKLAEEKKAVEEKLQKEKEDMVAKMEKLQKEALDINNAINTRFEAEKTLTEKVNGLQEQVKKLEEQKKTIEASSINEKEEAVKSKNADIQEKNRQINELSGRVKALKEEQEKKSKSADNINQKVSELEKTLAAVRVDNQTIGQTNIEKANKIQQLEAKNQQLTENLQKLGKVEADIVARIEELAQKKDEVLKLQNELQKKDGEIDDLKKKFDKMQQEMNERISLKNMDPSAFTTEHIKFLTQQVEDLTLMYEEYFKNVDPKDREKLKDMFTQLAEMARVKSIEEQENYKKRKARD